MSIIKKHGFTLVELMVVIVIIGVLASLAIPRFTSASDKAKAAEAPRILASYESAFLAAVAEYGSTGGTLATGAQIMFDLPSADAAGKSKWFTYAPATETGMAAGQLTATANTRMGGWQNALGTKYDFTAENFNRCAGGNSGDFSKLLPNFTFVTAGC